MENVIGSEKITGIVFVLSVLEIEMGLKWTDTIDIAIALDETHPDIDPLSVRFTDLRKWVCDLDEFDDDPNRSGEKILEAIQMAWIEARE